MNQCSQDTPKVRPSKPPVGKWNITTTGGKKCMLMQFGAQFIISYEMSNKTKSMVDYYLPNNTRDTGESSCSETKADFVIAFSPAGKKTDNDWKMMLSFTMDKDKSYGMSNFSLHYVV